MANTRSLYNAQTNIYRISRADITDNDKTISDMPIPGAYMQGG